MKPIILDLRTERCPMALLLAKRARANTPDEKVLKIFSQEGASVADMVRYFEGVGYTVEVLQHTYYEITVYRESLNARNG